MDLDILSFDALVQRVVEFKTMKKIDRVWERFISSQGSQKNVQKYTKALLPEKQRKAQMKTGDDFKRALQRR